MSWKEKPSYQRDLASLREDWGAWMDARGIDPEAMFAEIVARLTALGYPISEPTPPFPVIAAVVHEVYEKMAKEEGAP